MPPEFPTRSSTSRPSDIAALAAGAGASRLIRVLDEALAPAFRVESELPGAGMSRVFLASDLALNRKVVVKVLPPELATRTSVARFRREIAVMVKLHHPHVLPVLSAGSVGDVAYYLAPYIAGESLRTRLERDGVLPLPEIERVLTQLASALGFAHAHGVIHRDVKPGNVLLLDGNAVLADFGIARAADDEDGLTASDTRPGTVAYFAPERPENEQADLYALAVVGWEMLTGSRPRGAVGMREALIARQRYDVADQPRTMRRLTAALTAALDPRLERRFPSADGFARALVGAPAWRAPTGTRGSRIPRPARAAFAALLVVGGAAGYRVVRAGTERDVARAGDALARWDLPRAESLLRPLVTRQPHPLRVDVLVARLALYSGADSLQELGQAAAAEALRQRATLDARDRLFVNAILQLLREDFPAACDGFRRRIATDDDFDGYFGLGECLRRDAVVVSRLGTPSGYVFRGSWTGAAAAYERAIRRLPPPHPAFVHRRLAQVLPIETSRLRAGYSADKRIQFRAYPALADDSMAFVPYPTANALGASGVPVPATRTAALQQNMFRLRRDGAAWVQMAPNSAEAHESFALLLETMGDISETGAEDASAFTEIRRARRLVGDGAIALAATEVRLLLKDGQVARARALADSALVRWDGSLDTAPWAASLAALTGRADRVAQLLRALSATQRYAPRLRGVPLVLAPGIRRARADLLAYGAMGVCTAPLRALADQIANAVESDFTDPAQRALTRDALLARPVALAVPCVGPRSIGVVSDRGDGLARVVRAFDAGGRRGLAAALDSLGRARRFSRAGDITLDQSFLEAWLLAAAGDSAAALSRVGRALAGVPLAPPNSLLEVPVMSSLVRSWLLGARLARDAGDRERARTWAAYVVDAWSGADPGLQPAVAEMRRLLADGVGPAPRGSRADTDVTSAERPRDAAATGRPYDRGAPFWRLHAPHRNTRLPAARRDDALVARWLPHRRPVDSADAAADVDGPRRERATRGPPGPDEALGRDDGG